MMNVIIANDLHDKTWLANYSCAPLLVSDADGTYLHTDSGAYCAWDTATNTVVEAAPSQGRGRRAPRAPKALGAHRAFRGERRCVPPDHGRSGGRSAEVDSRPRRRNHRRRCRRHRTASLGLCQGSACSHPNLHRLLTLLPWLRNLPSDRDTFRPLRVTPGSRRGGSSRNNGGACIDGASLSFTGSSGADTPLMNSAEWDTVGDGASFGTFMGATLAVQYRSRSVPQRPRLQELGDLRRGHHGRSRAQSTSSTSPPRTSSTRAPMPTR